MSIERSTVGIMVQPVPWSTGAHLTNPPYCLRQWVPAQLMHTLVGPSHSFLPLPSGSLYEEIEVQGKLMEKQREMTTERSPGE